jgi:glycosyltransferase involved in cell wall biosynthesis
MNGEDPREIGGLVVIDNSYTLEMVEQRGIQDSVLCRDLNGFFNHVWTVHPFASMLTSRSWSSEFGRPDRHEMNARHTFIEGKVGRWLWLQRFFAGNFLASQLLLLIDLAALVRRNGVRVVRAGDPLYAGLFGWCLARVTRARLVIRVNGNNDKVRESVGKPLFPRLFRTIAMEKRVERFVLRHADLVVAPNEDNLRFALANGADPATSTVFRYGNLIARQHLVPPAQRVVDPALLTSLGIERDRFLLYIARLEPVKLPDHTVLALAEVRRCGHDVKLVIVGDGQMGPQLRVLAREHGVDDHLVLPGNQSQETLAQLIVAAAVVVSPHTGRALTEAAYGAAPIVAYDIDWQGELIEDGQTGELVPFEDIAAMAGAVDTLLGDPIRARRLGDAVLARARDMLDPERLDDHERVTYRALFARMSSHSALA